MLLRVVRTLRDPHKAASIAIAMIAAAALAFVASASAATSVQGAGVIAIVNEQRAANGIPPITTDDQSYASSWCPREFEAPLTQGETGRVSASTDNWSATTTPYSTAPLHQYVIYAPLATIAGDVDTTKGEDCMGVGQPDLLSAVTAPAPTFYAFVNERGPHYAVSSELARELPTTPQQQLGEPAATRTGPQLLLFEVGLGFSPHAASVTLQTSAGTIVPDVKVAPETEGGVLVSPPLRPGTSYVLHIEWTGEPRPMIEGFETTVVPGQSATQTLSFATAPAPKAKHHRRRAHRP